jgi:hypothetical protein
MLASTDKTPRVASALTFLQRYDKDVDEVFILIVGVTDGELGKSLVVN